MKLKKLIKFLIFPLLFVKTFAAVVPDDSEIPASPAFLHSAFYTANYFYLGTNATGKKAYSVARTYLYNDTAVEGNPIKVGVAPLSPSTAFINSQGEGAQKKSNPVYNADIKSLTLQGSAPVVLLGTRNPAYTDAPTGADQTVCLVGDPDTGESVWVNTKALKDAGGLDTNGIVSIEGSRSYIFAAVSPNGGTFGDANSGIAVLAPSAKGLESIDATTGKVGNKAQDAITPAGTDISVQNHSVMHWDQKLGRLFVGLEISTGLGSSTAFSLLVGRLKGLREPLLTLEEALPAAAVNSTTDYIVTYDGILDQDLKIHHIKTMHTSTGKSYVIVCGNVNSSDQKEAFALPIVNKQYPTVSLTNDNDIGKIAEKDDVDQSKVVSTEAQTTKKNSDAAIIGAGNAPADIQKMFVKNDAVYICCIDNTSKATKGIFKSSAIFKENGLIRKWTPWERVMGAPDRVFGADIDDSTGNFWYLTEKTPTSGSTADYVKVTRWDTKDTNLLGNLRDAISEEFPKETGGIHQLFDFDTKTPCFSEDEFSMMIGTGLEKVALIRTGLDDGTSFAPTSGNDFVGANLSNNLKIYSNDALKSIGPICCAEVTKGAEGWVFVGGYNGLAVLSDVDGGGLTTVDDLTTNFNNFTFKKLGSFKNIHKIVSDDTYLYFLTPKAVYRIELDATKFDGVPTAALNAEIIAQPTYSNIPTCNQYDSFLDLIVTNKLGILATTSGLYRTSNGKNIADNVDVNEARNWTQVLTKAGNNLGPVTHLSFLRKPSTVEAKDGNFYAVAGNMSTNLSTIVRFDFADTSASAIDDNTVSAVGEKKERPANKTRDYYYPFGGFRAANKTDGTFSFHSLSKHFGDSNLFKKINMNSNLTSARFSDRTLLIDLESDASNIGIPVKNSTSGAWMVPGDWGIRINE